MSSHSDSELRMDTKFKPKKNLHVAFKSRERIQNSGILLLNGFKTMLKNSQPNFYEQRLLSAASTNNTETVHRLLVDNVNPNSVDSQQRSALHLAVSKGYVDVVELLLQYKANPNAQDIIGNTPLHLAACSSNLKIIMLLLNAGADLQSLDIHGRSPLELAQSKLQILRRSWKSGIIEMIQLRDQLQQIVDIMISLRRSRTGSVTNVPTSCSTINIDDLEMLKLSINSGAEEEVDDQMTRLMEKLKGFSL